MKIRITIDIDSNGKLNPRNLQEIKMLVEETVIENLRMPEGIKLFINSKVTKEKD